MLCRAISCSTAELLATAQRVLMYRSHHRSICLHFARWASPVSGYSDSDRATSHSTSGYVFMYNRAAISSASKKQPSAGLSSYEAEIIAASEATKEADYLCMLFADLGLPPAEPTTLAMANKSAIDHAYNAKHHQRSKHIDCRHCFICKRVEMHDTTVSFVCSADNMLAAPFFLQGR
eukprot:1882342-Pleurochrysis_carterae.AAC.1